ncbi:DUF262 domain-containing protein [Lactococcus lactis]|uniref:DUF262 domain-containing protein n=1 Tax=Lactococcus lactis TaxID=1358 RepID=UPI002073EFE0|nr:DUF262 domain-containing protein [Lactococcus lactis]
MRNKEKLTLQELLNNKVTIPAIQRDYAFGRTDAITANKRKEFIAKLASVINGEQDNLHLDFVYGKKLSESFIPLDGQQRITTLWLLSIYLYKSLAENSEGVTFLDNFSYATRTSTREFCLSILKEDWNCQEATIEYFQNQKWFFNSWRFDPTIMGMLVVLEEIRNALPDGGNITKLNNITFSFLDVEELGQPEELYVKMNSRGKQLSDWDNFKAELFELDSLNCMIPSDDENVVERSYKEWVDTEFLDFFWDLGTDGKDKAEFTESRMLRFFKMNFFLNRMFSTESAENNATEVIKFNQKNWKEQIDEIFLKSLKIFVDFIKTNKEKIEEYEFARFDKGLRVDDLCSVLKKDDSDDGYIADLDLYFAYWQYIQKTATTSFDVAELANILRITANFEESYRKDYDITQRYLKSFKEAIDYGSGILQYFAKEDLSYISFGSNSDEQKLEEIEKAKLLLGTDFEQWSKNIYTAEKHPYFNGTIGWILRLSNNTSKEFELLSPQLLNRFDENGLKNRLDVSCMVKYTDLRVQGFNWFFPKNNGDDGAGNLLRDRSWKRYFRDRGYKKDTTLEIDISWINQWLSEVEVDIEKLDLWKQWLIHYPSILNRIGAIDIWGDVIVGLPWRVRVFSSNKYNLAIVAAQQEIGGFDYWGNMDSTINEVYIDDKSVNLSFDNSRNEYIISKEGTEIERVSAKPIANAIEQLRLALDKL